MTPIGRSGRARAGKKAAGEGTPNRFGAGELKARDGREAADLWLAGQMARLARTALGEQPAGGARAATAAATSDPEAWFQRARLAEVFGQPAEAWDALGRAVGLDRRLGVAAATDPAFARYLDQPAFRSLIGLIGIAPLPSPPPR